MHYQICRHKSLDYLIRYPDRFEENNLYPAILFLHGAGTRGRDLELLKSNPFFLHTENHRDFPFVVIAPQCWEVTWFEVWEQLKSLAEAVSALPFVDAGRFYAMGASMGGYATWQIAISMPERFAAIVPICGGGMYWSADRLTDVPVWAFHGALDLTVFPEESVKMVNAVNAAGGNAELTLYPNNAHDAWSDTYSDPRVLSWLLEQKKEDSRNIPRQEYRDPRIYG